MTDPVQQDRDDIYPWGYNHDEVREYYETTRREKAHEATLHNPTDTPTGLYHTAKMCAVRLIKIFD